MAQSLTLTQGVSAGFAWPIVDLAGAPAVLTGYTARCQVREREDVTSTLLATLTATVDVPNSRVTVTWGDAESRAWTWTYGRSDVILMDATGGILIVWEGTFTVDAVVTSNV